MIPYVIRRRYSSIWPPIFTIKMAQIIRILFFVFIVRPLLGFFIGIRVRGRNNLLWGHPFIIIANHASHLDTAALMNLFPLKDLSRIRPVAAADYFNRNRIIALTSRLFFNILPIERKHICRDHNPLADLREVLMKGESLIVFPEGTRSSSGEMGPFHSGVAHLIKEYPQIPVIPVYMSNMGRALPKGEFVILPFICEINIGTSIFPTGSKEEITEMLRQAVIQLKGESTWQH